MTADGPQERSLMERTGRGNYDKRERDRKTVRAHSSCNLVSNSTHS